MHVTGPYLTGEGAGSGMYQVSSAEEARRVVALFTVPRDCDKATLRTRITQAVTAEAIYAHSHLCRLKEAYAGQRASFTHLREQAITDSLTKLLNRRGFLELAERRMDAPRIKGRGVCVLMIDLDGLKSINDTQGHQAGDQYLAGFAKLLRRYFDEDDLIARFGGDEFAVVVSNVDRSMAQQAAHRVAGQLLESRLQTGAGAESPVSCSIGAVYFDPAGREGDIEDVLYQADHAMYARKRAGKGGVNFTEFNTTPALDSHESTSASPPLRIHAA